MFQVVVLGCLGGPRESNLSGYLLAPVGSQEWISLDAGSLLTGIDAALVKGSLEGEAGEILKQIRGFVISHAHLDHICGLVLNSQKNMQKYVLGIDKTIDNLRDHIFNGQIWPNYGNEGIEPLGYYEYVRLVLLEKKAIPETSMTVEPFLLSHPDGYPSTAFLIEHRERYMLYFGDTSSDSQEHEKHLERIWHRIAPLLQYNRFHGMLLECSCPHSDAEQTVYGHLDTQLMMQEMHRLAEIAKVSLKGLKVIVTHRKENLKKGFDALKKIEEELTGANDLGIQFIFPTQGDRFTL